MTIVTYPNIMWKFDVCIKVLDYIFYCSLLHAPHTVLMYQPLPFDKGIVCFMLVVCQFHVSKD